MRTLALLSAVLWLAPNVAEAGSPSDAFARLKALVGTWDVEDVEDVEHDERHVVYSLSGGGETLVEEFKGEPTMASFYHMDGEKLMLTHYCNAGNQPRMTAATYDEAKGVVSFRFLDVTNLKAPDAYHTRDLDVRFLSDDRIELTFTGLKEGQTLVSVVQLKRRPGGS